MSFCVERGIPHSQFLEWDPEDRAKVLAYLMEQSSRCVSCGTAQWEWQENKFAYLAVDEHCPGCYQRAVASEAQGNSLPGTNVRLVPTSPLLRAQQQVTAKKRAAQQRE